MKHTIKKTIGLLTIIASLFISTVQANEVKLLRDNPEELDNVTSSQMCMTVYYNLSVYFAMADELNLMIGIADPRKFFEKSYTHTKSKFEKMQQIIAQKEMKLKDYRQALTTKLKDLEVDLRKMLLYHHY